MGYVTRLIDGTTMYRVVMYALFSVAFAAFTLSVAGLLTPGPIWLCASLAIIIAAASAAHYACTFITKAPGNFESTIITALILFLILLPATSIEEFTWLALVAVLSVVGKYIIRYHYRHVFNPVALALVIAAAVGYYGVSWWVGSQYLWPVVLVAGSVVVYKTRRWPLALAYLGFSSVLALILFGGQEPATMILRDQFTSWPTLFFVAFMLTEPLGLPSTRRLQYAYALLAAGIATVPFTLGPLSNSPELALLAANVFTFAAERPTRLLVKLTQKRVVGGGTVEYLFTPQSPVHFIPGQYLEWTLPHQRADRRGIRRYFTIVTAPASETVGFAVRHVAEQSSWKTTLATLAPGSMLYATQRAGDFVLRPNAAQQVWIAGGIGVTPFISMLRDAKQTERILRATLFYCNTSAADIAFFSEVEAARENGVEIVHVLQQGEGAAFSHEVGFVTADMLKQHVADWQRATFYISGPPGLVRTYTALLRGMGISRRRIVTDYFPGLA